MKNLNNQDVSELEELLIKLENKVLNPRLSLGLINVLYNKKKTLYISWEKENFIEICENFDIPYIIDEDILFITNDSQAYSRISNTDFKEITDKEMGYILGYPKESVKYRCSNDNTVDQTKYMIDNMRNGVLTKKDILEIETYNFYNIKPTIDELIKALKKAKSKKLLYNSISKSIKRGKEMKNIEEQSLRISKKVIDNYIES